MSYGEEASPGKQRYNAGFNRAFDVCLVPGPLQHEVLRNLEVVKSLGGAVQNTALDLHLMPEDRAYARRMLDGVDEACVIVAVGIGARSPGRRWPLERYAAFLSELSKQYDLNVVITCSPLEHQSAAHLAAVIESPSIISESAEIRETCALLERCDLFIGNDAGAAHLAAAMNCPTIVISRHAKTGDPAHPNSPARFAPWCASALVLQPERGRGQCTTRCLHTEPHCIEQVSVAQVVTAAKAMLMQRTHASDQLEESLRW